MGITRLNYLSNASGITPYLIWSLRYLCFKLKLLHSLESGNSFGCILFLSNLTTESGKVVWIKVVENFVSFPTILSTLYLDSRNSRYDCFTELLLLRLVQKISKFWMFDNRCLEEEEAEVVEVFPHIHHHHQQLLNNSWQYRHSSCKRWCRISRTNRVVEHHAISVVNSWRAAPGVLSCHWSIGSRWLASCSGKATQHSAVRRPAEGVVRVRTTPGRSSRLVGGIRVWTSH